MTASVRSPLRILEPQNAQAPAALEMASPVSAAKDHGLLHALLTVEQSARETKTKSDLQFLIVNETRKLIGAAQVFLFTAGPPARAAAISDLAVLDPNAAIIESMERLVAGFCAEHAEASHRVVGLSGLDPAQLPALKTYPYSQALWIPLRVRKTVTNGGLLLTRQVPWAASDIALAQRLAGTFAHALALHEAQAWAPWRLKEKLARRKAAVSCTAAVLIATLLFPVSMTALAPFETVPREPSVIAAAIDGVIEKILVEPNAEVKAGQPLVQFADVLLRNRLDVAQREAQVAEAQTKQATQLGFDQLEGRNGVSIAAAEHRLRLTELKAAQEMLGRATITAPRDGVALYHDKSALTGKPAALGERIMLLADPKTVDFAVDVPVSDSLLLKPGARVKLFLDSDPVHPREATVEYADYQARSRPGGALAYRVVARLADESDPPRLGVRGTAQLYGERVSLGFYLFRRPISAIRQWIGI